VLRLIERFGPAPMPPVLIGLLRFWHLTMQAAATILRRLMFIAHGEKFRKNARWIMAAVLLLLIPGFIALFTTTTGTTRREAELPKIKGKPLNAADFDRARNTVLAQLLMSGQRIQHTPQLENEIDQLAVQNTVLLRKARELGIHVTDDQVIAAIQSQPFFLTQHGQFEGERYRQYLIYLNNNGISESRFEEIMRQQLVIDHLRDLIGSAAKVTPDEAKLSFEPLHERVSIDYVSFDVADQREHIDVTDAEARDFYEKNKNAFRTPAQMKVRYVLLPFDTVIPTIKVTDTELADYYERTKSRHADTNNVPKPLEVIKDQVHDELLSARADRATADRATEFTIKLVREPGEAAPDFAKLASEAGLQAHETDFFAPTNTVAGVKAVMAFNNAAFTLTPDNRFSDPVPGEDGYYVLEYVAKKPSEIPSFESVKEDIVRRITAMRSLDATVRRGQDALTKVREQIKAGKTFEEVCAQLKLKLQSPPPFAVADQKPELPPAAAQRIQETVLGLPTNAVSEFVQTSAGGLFFHVKSRQPPEPKEVEKELKRVSDEISQRNRQAIFQDWVVALMREQNVQIPRRPTPAPVSETPEPSELPVPQNVPVEPAPPTPATQG
jgi:peptidyl-prolyl cis-trans isomerase D